MATTAGDRRSPAGDAPSVDAPGSRQAARRQATRDEIVTAAWELARDAGLAAVNLRELAARVGMKAPSLYSYFASKHDIYDAMFMEGYQAFDARMAAVQAEHADGRDPRAQATASALAFFEFCTSDPARYQLLFQRTVPGFEPSPESYAVAQSAYGRFAAQLAAHGVTDPADLDLWSAVMTGLTDQQISNDPGGTRWERLVGRAVDMLLRETAPHLFDAPSTRHPSRSTTRRTR